MSTRSAHTFTDVGCFEAQGSELNESSDRGAIAESDPAVGRRVLSVKGKEKLEGEMKPLSPLHACWVRLLMAR